MSTITTLRGGRIQRRDGQRGQALIYGIFVLIGALASLFFLFNTGQLSQEKTKLVSTADAAAYSAGVMHARAMNFTAYGNRALIANEVLVAQMVSLSSWAQYAQTHAENLPTQFPECNDPYGYGAAIGAAFKYGPVYALMCYGTVQYAGEYIHQIAETMPPLASATVSAVEVNKRAIQLAHDLLLNNPSYLQSIRRSVMQDVAQANYAGDGSVKVEPIGPGAAVALTDDLDGFTQSYSGKDRGRIAKLAVYAAHSDRFTKERVWTAEAEVPGPDEICILMWRKSEVRRRGGTELVNYDEWIAEDTESFWRAQRKGGLIPRCRLREEPIAWGEQQAHPEDQDDSGAWLGGARTNAKASSQASSNKWRQYTGLPSYYDLSKPQLTKDDDPTLRFSVRLSRAHSQLRTSDSASQITSTSDSRINAYQSQVAKGEMVAVATSEVFFERPLAQRHNRYGASQGLPLELPSLFNPYWQVRLIHSQTDVLGQQIRQGGQIP